MEEDIKFDIVDWCMENFTEEELQWMSEMSAEVLANKYWSSVLPESDYSMKYDGDSGPFDEWDYVFKSEQPNFILQG